MSDSEKDPLTDAVEDGSYYKNARNWYSDIFHNPIAERSYYIITTILSLICFYCSVEALIRLHPISPTVALTIYSDDIWDNIPRIKKLAESSEEDKNAAVEKYMISDYVMKHESYDLPKYEFRYRNVWSHSTPAVFEQYKQNIDANNPSSPYRQFADQEVRNINIRSIQYTEGPQTSHAEVIFDASIVSTETKKEIQSTLWKADITYQYTDFYVEDAAGGSKKPHTSLLGLTEDATKGSGEKKEITPMTFIVSDYKVKELLNENN